MSQAAKPSVKAIGSVVPATAASPQRAAAAGLGGATKQATAPIRYPR